MSEHLRAQADATPDEAADGNVVLTMIEDLPGTPKGRRFACATGDMPLPPGGLAYVVEVEVSEGAPDGQGGPHATGPLGADTPSDAGVPVAPGREGAATSDVRDAAAAPTDAVDASGSDGSNAPADAPTADAISHLRIVGYIDRFSRAFSVDGPLSMPPAQRPDLQLLRYADQDGTLGCVELLGEDPDDEPWRVAEFRATDDGHLVFTDSRVELGAAGEGCSPLALSHAVSLAFLAFCYLPRLRGESLSALSVGDVLDRLGSEGLFDAIDHIVATVERAEASSFVTPPGIVLYLVRMLHAAGAVGVTAAGLAARVEGVPDATGLSWATTGTVAPAPLLPGLFVAMQGPTEPQVHLVRTTEYANMFYVAFNRAQVSDGGACLLLEIEGILNRFLLIVQRLDDAGVLMTATQAQCAEVDRWVIEDILAPGLAALRATGLLAGAVEAGHLAELGEGTLVPDATGAVSEADRAPAADVGAAEKNAAEGRDGAAAVVAEVHDGERVAASSVGVTGACSMPDDGDTIPALARSEVDAAERAAGTPATDGEAAPVAPSDEADASTAGSAHPARIEDGAAASDAPGDLLDLGPDAFPTFAPEVVVPAPERGDLDVRLAFARACESLQLPFRLEYRFRYDAVEGALSVDIGCPDPSVMPRELWDRSSDAWRALSDEERAGSVTRYVFHLAALVACAAFACDGRVSRVVINAWGTEEQPANGAPQPAGQPPEIEDAPEPSEAEDAPEPPEPPEAAGAPELSDTLEPSAPSGEIASELEAFRTYVEHALQSLFDLVDTDGTSSDGACEEDTTGEACLLSASFERAPFLATLAACDPARRDVSDDSPVDAESEDPAAEAPLATPPTRSSVEENPADLVRRTAHAYRLDEHGALLPVRALVRLDAFSPASAHAHDDIETDARPLGARASRLLRAQRVRDLGIYEDAPRRTLADQVRSAFASDDLSKTLAAIRGMHDRTENTLVRAACLRVSEGIVSGALTKDSTDEFKEIFSDIYGLKAGLRSASRLAQRGDQQAAARALASLIDHADEQGWFADSPTRVYRYFDCYASRVLYATHCARSLDGDRELRLCADEYFLAHHRLATLLSDSIEYGEQSIEHARRCVELAPSVAASYLRLARCYFCAFDYESEINVLNRMLTIAWNPTDVAMALYWLGYAYWMTDRPRLGLACYQRCVAYDRNLAEPCSSEVADFARREGARPQPLDDDEVRELMRQGGVPLGQVRLNAEALVRAAGFAADAGSYRLAQNLLGSASVILRDDALAPVLESYGEG